MSAKLQATSPTAAKHLGETPETAVRPVPPMVQLYSVAKWYGSRRVLDNVSHSFAQGKVAVICGPSGCGKSTLLRCIHALDEFQEGEIKIAGRSLKDRSVNLPKLRSQIGSVFQQSNL